MQRLDPNADLYPAYLKSYLKADEHFEQCAVVVTATGEPVQVALVGFHNTTACAKQGYHCVVTAGAEGISIGDAAARAATVAREILSGTRKGRVAWFKG